MSALVSRLRPESILILALCTLLAACGSSHRVACLSSTGNCPCGTCPINPGPEFLYATSNAGGGQTLSFTIDHTTGALANAGTAPGPALASGITSAQNQFLYLSDTLHGQLAGFSINPTTGALTTIPGSPFSNGGLLPFSPLSLVAGSHLYATGLTGITGFTIASNGALSPILGSFFPGGITGQAALGQTNTSPANTFLYATNFLDPNGTISASKVDPTSGILTMIPGTFTTGAFSGPDGIVFDGTVGPFVFVALNTANQIAAFSVDPSTGVLSPVPGSPFASGIQPVFLALDSSQKFLYSMNFANHSISGYSIAANGALTQVPGSPFFLADVPGGIAVSADNFLYVTLPRSNAILGFSINANGGLSPLAGSPFTASAPILLTTVQVPAP